MVVIHKYRLYEDIKLLARIGDNKSTIINYNSSEKVSSENRKYQMKF